MGNMEQDNMKTEAGIGLYKVSYEMDVKGSSREHNYTAGVIAYTSKEAIDTLMNFSKKNIKGFRGFKINEVSFDGNCHAISDEVKSAVLKTAIAEGLVIKKEDYETALAESEKAAKKPAKKTSIIPKEAKE